MWLMETNSFDVIDGDTERGLERRIQGIYAVVDVAVYRCVSISWNMCGVDPAAVRVTVSSQACIAFDQGRPYWLLTSSTQVPTRGCGSFVGSFITTWGPAVSSLVKSFCK